MTFDPFKDYESEGYLRNRFKLKDPDEIKKLEHLAFESSLEEALELLEHSNSITYQTVLRVHEMLFAELYPWAGKDRAELTPGLAVFKGTSTDPHHTAFCPPSEIRRLVDHALTLAGDPAYLKAHPGEILGMLADAHPFLDGNGRTLLIVFMELCYRAGFAVDWSKTSKQEYLNALSDEIRTPSRGILDNYLLPHLAGIHDRAQWPTLIVGIRGLDGLDKENISYASLDDPAVQQLYAHYRSE